VASTRREGYGKQYRYSDIIKGAYGIFSFNALPEFVEKVQAEQVLRYNKKRAEGKTAGYKHTDAEDGQGMFMPINLKEQLLSGSFEHMLDELIGGKIDASVFDNNYKNNETGAKAIPPAVLIKLILYGYSKGRTSSRELWDLGMNNITAKALSGDMEPHWTTIANFISGNNEKFKEIFAKVLAYCAELDLIGGQTFAIDGLRLPSNASLDLTGTAEDLGKRLKVYRRMAEKHIEKHKRKDAAGEVDGETERHYQEQQKKLNRKIEKINYFLETMEKKEGKRGQEITSNVTDNESAMIHSPSGYIQGYIGLAVSDRKEQIIVSAEAVGSANECEHFPRILDMAMDNIKEADVKIPEDIKPVMLADNNYFSEENLKACHERGLEPIMPDGSYKSRLGRTGKKRYETADFKYHEEGNCYECPAGKKLTCKGASTVPGGRTGKVYRASVTDCRLCPCSEKCMGHKKKPPKRPKGRTLFITESNEHGSYCQSMREKLNEQEYQDQYAYRIQIIEPVFANIAYCKGLDRFTLRGAVKVNGQWLLYCIVHNLGKCLKGFNKGQACG
jgi:transposase